ncbi:MAG TPA: glycoside hydrolase family 3 N-terminal domain-containing protein [Thermotogota bacterium]|nr:glycoside hydrolase family 3 N-terminal domain-containing protein [Thermotogota bacterium]
MEAYKDKNNCIDDRVEDLIQRMTLEEKIAQLTSIWSYEVFSNGHFSGEKADQKIQNGIGQITRPGGATFLEPRDLAAFINQIQEYLMKNTRLGIPAMLHEECLCGYLTKNATMFPQMIGLASAWDEGLVEDVAGAIRDELRTVNAHQALSPLMDVTRDPRWGRTEETFGEDPYLVGALGSAYVKGLQTEDIKRGVVATLKHFVGYGVSEGGMNWAPPHIPNREMREVFLLPFERAIREAGAKSVMNGYHELDSVPCGASKWLLTQVLRNEWEFDGIVVSDYFAIDMLKEYHRLVPTSSDAAKSALEAGLDVELPFTRCYEEPLKRYVEEGKITTYVLERSLKRILKLKFEMGIFDNPYINIDQVPVSLNSKEHREIALKAAEKSLVLLKNEDNLLPLSENFKKIALIGPNAADGRNQLGDYSYPAHMESLMDMKQEDHFGSPVPDFEERDFSAKSVVNVLEGINTYKPENVEVLYQKGCFVTGDDADIDTALETASQADIVILCLGDKSGLIPDCTTGEARDSMTLELPGRQLELAKAIFNTGKPVISVIISGRPYNLSVFEEGSKAILQAWLPGEEGGNAIAKALFGKINPSGKLPISFPRHVGQIPVYYNHKASGQRSHWFGDYVDGPSKPLYHFGYGLSYTHFEYSNLVVQEDASTDSEEIEIKFSVKNTGTYDGEEIVQLYVNDPAASVTRPVKELKGFEKVFLKQGEQKTLRFLLPVELLAFFNDNMNLIVEPGQYIIMIGQSSENIVLEQVITLMGEQKAIEKRSRYSSILMDD